MNRVMHTKCTASPKFVVSTTLEEAEFKYITMKNRAGFLKIRYINVKRK
jgi:hypothetical protein